MQSLRQFAFIFVVVATLGTGAIAQGTPDLSVTGSGLPNDVMTFSVSPLASQAATAVLVSMTAGSIELISGVNLSIGFPVALLCMGDADVVGNFSKDLVIPSVPALSGQTWDFMAQAVTAPDPLDATNLELSDVEVVSITF